MAERNAAEEIRQLREALGLTQEQFAREVGVSFSTVSRWETARGEPSPLAWRRIEDLRSRLSDKEKSR
jgi:DNA-binding transcriptional regulator YiaG